MMHIRNSTFKLLSHHLRVANSAVRKRSTGQFRSAPVPGNAIDVGDEVAQAILDDTPLVALETTIVTHGMPYPENLQTAQNLERIIRENGAVPATTAILRGRPTVGLSESQLSRLADLNGSHSKAVKTSRRDLAYVMACALDGGTTVSGTIVLARAVGIPIFVTGGIGGVHRLGHETMDVSADLTELGRNRICVISSGVKSILDISRTLEYLETQGVTVASYSNGGEFPAFYARRSGSRAPCDVTGAVQAARMVAAAEQLGLSSGMLIAVPVPDEHALDEVAIEAAIQEALEDAEARGVRGKEVTPHILATVAKVTQGKSLQTNIALVKNNALVGAQIAVELKKLNSANGEPYLDHSTPFFQDGRRAVDSRRDALSDLFRFGGGGPFQRVSNPFDVGSDCEVPRDGSGAPRSPNVLRPVVVGGSNVDLSFRVSEPEIKVSE